MFDHIKQLGHRLVQGHGAGVGAVAKIAAHALIPGAPLLVAAVESACDYAADKGQELTDEKITEMIEGLGGDVQHLEALMGHLSGQLDGVVGMMTQSAQFGASPDMLEAMMNSALENQFSPLRDELRALTPELETVKRQMVEMLRAQGAQGDMLHQMQETLEASVAYHHPLASEGITPAQAPHFLAAEGRFKSAMVSRDLPTAEAALAKMKSISPNGNTAKVHEMALLTLERDFDGAERVARTITGAGSNDPRVQRARQSLTKLTQARVSGATPPSAEPQRYDVGSEIGDKGWRLTGLLGRGGMGSVWRAKNSRGQDGAVKLMSASLSSDPQFISRFRSEIDALDRVSHASVIDILDWGRDQLSGSWYFVMTMIEGVSLKTKLSRGPIEESQVKSLARALASALVACHAQGVIHRDIKPENIMLRGDGSPVLIDFGIAHQDGISTGHTGMATGGYAPPEQLAGEQVDGTADLFALGMTLAKCLGSKVGEGMWRELISQLTHFMPSVRGTAQALFAKLSETPKTYYATVPGTDPEGPLSVVEVAVRVLAGADTLMLWWQGESAWVKWDTVAEIKTKVEAKRQVTPPPLTPQMTPPPPPPAPKRQLKAGDVITSRVKGQEFKLNHIPAGEFWMGSKEGDGYDDERPRHKVRITKPFLIGQTQVTQSQWEAVMGSNPSHFKGGNLPVETVSWFDCIRFCNALSEAEGLQAVYDIGSGDQPTVSLDFGRTGYRLPTEAEWEYAAKAGTELTYAGSNNVDEVAWLGSNSGGKTNPVGTKKPNMWGLHDMSGNVFEWCSDQWNDSAYQGHNSIVSDPHEWVGSAVSRVAAAVAGTAAPTAVASPFATQRPRRPRGRPWLAAPEVRTLTLDT